MKKKKCKNCRSWHIVPDLMEDTHEEKYQYGKCSCKVKIAGTTYHNEVCFREDFGCINFN